MFHIYFCTIVYFMYILKFGRKKIKKKDREKHINGYLNHLENRFIRFLKLPKLPLLHYIEIKKTIYHKNNKCMSFFANSLKQ